MLFLLRNEKVLEVVEEDNGKDSDGLQLRLITFYNLNFNFQDFAWKLTELPKSGFLNLKTPYTVE